MKVFSKIADLTEAYPKLVIALGAFDGVHVGHQSIIHQAMELAASIGGHSMVFTFSNHPLSVIAPQQMPAQIGDNLSREQILAALGVDVLVSVPFTKELARISPEEFLALLRDNFAPRYVVVGPNYTFGYRGKGTQRLLQRLAGEYGFQAEICPAVLEDGRPVSSTRIRELIKEGELIKVNAFLGRPFTFSGRVMHGDRRGRKLGFPTANLAIGEQRAMLPNGVYAVRVLYRGSFYYGIANIGTNPTFAGCTRRLEVNIFDFAGDLYDQPLQVEFWERLRNEQKFSSSEYLVRQLHKDMKAAHEIFHLQG